MDTTQFLASIWGPILIAVSLGMFFSARYYEKIYRDLEKDVLAALVFGLSAMTVGIVQVQFHNVWDTPLQIVISLIGWATLVKGAVLVIAPHLADNASHTWLKLRVMPSASVGMLAIGAYLSYLAYVV